MKKEVETHRGEVMAKVISREATVCLQADDILTLSIITH